MSQVSPAVFRIGVAGNGIPGDGDFKLLVKASTVKDVAGNVMLEDAAFNFTFLSADASQDRKVDTLDFNLLAGHFAETASHFSQGDFNFDGVVDSVDFTLLVSSFGKALPPLPLPGALLFGSSPIPLTEDTPADVIWETQSV